MQFDELVIRILEAKEAPSGKHYDSAGRLRKGDADSDGRGGPKYRSDPTYNNPNDPEDEEKKKGVDGKACWDGYRYAGTENGKDKCVKVGDEEIPAEDAEKVDKDRMKCNSPRRTSGGSKKFVVKACKDGKEKIVRFGDPNMRIKKSNPKRRKSFRARHKCDQKKDKFSAGYWSCKKW
tara:strand:+ start:422 stop:955 length:534 start_codon:yes stop_codon:yes gene_type:complete